MMSYVRLAYVHAHHLSPAVSHSARAGPVNNSTPTVRFAFCALRIELIKFVNAICKTGLPPFWCLYGPPPKNLSLSCGDGDVPFFTAGSPAYGEGIGALLFCTSMIIVGTQAWKKYFHPLSRPPATPLNTPSLSLPPPLPPLGKSPS